MSNYDFPSVAAERWAEQEHERGLATRKAIREALASSADKRIAALEQQVRELQQSVNYMASLLLEEPIQGGEPVRMLTDAVAEYQTGGE